MDVNLIEGVLREVSQVDGAGRMKNLLRHHLAVPVGMGS